MVSKSISIMETGINHRPHTSLMLLGAGRVSSETGDLTFNLQIIKWLIKSAYVSFIYISDIITI